MFFWKTECKNLLCGPLYFSYNFVTIMVHGTNPTSAYGQDPQCEHAERWNV